MKWYVNASAGRSGNGSKESPFKTIQAAADVAQPGDDVLVYPGIYREYVNPKNSGREDARITYTSVEPLAATITGAEPVTDWKLYKGTTYVTRVDNSLFGTYNPYIQEVEGDWYFAQNHMHTGNVFVNDRMFYETDTLEECLEGKVYDRSWEPEFSIYKWFTEQDTATNETIIYANFQDMKPADQKVEITVRRKCFMPTEKYRGYITLSGFTVCKAATTWAPPAAY